VTNSETLSSPPAAIALGDTVRRMDRDGLWLVVGIHGSRALLRAMPIRPEWASLSDLVRVEGTTA
jgi:hypothetical protein